MTRDEIIKLARVAGFCWPDIQTTTIEQRLEHFAALVAAAEREACAQVCEQTYPTTLDGDLPCYETPEEFAAAIRARSQQ